MSDTPTLLCLTGFLGSGKTTVKNMFAKYQDVEVCSDIDKMKDLKTKKKLIVFDSIKSMDERTYLKWVSHCPTIVVNVECPTETRIQRVKERDGCSDMAFHLRDKEGKNKLYDLSSLVKYNIHNGRSLEETSGQVYYIHDLLTRDHTLELLKFNLTNQK